jgi:hypothetical protein
MLMGTNVKREVINIPLDEKTLTFLENEKKNVIWNMNYPNEKRRFNFIGYLQWNLNNKNTGIISAFLFTSGLEYDISIDKLSPIIKNNEIKAFEIILSNNEIEKLFCNLKLILRKDSEEIILESSEWINYKLNTRIDVPSDIKNDFDYNLQIWVQNNLAIQSGWQTYSSKIKEKITFNIICNVPQKPSGKVKIPYDYILEGEKIINETNYGGIQILKLNNNDILLSYNLIPLFSSQWNKLMKDEPSTWDRFRDDFFSYIYLKDPEFSANIKSEIKIWQANEVIIRYLEQFIKAKYTGEKKKEFNKTLEKIYQIINTITNNLSIILKNNFITPKLYQSLCLYKKQYYLDFLSLKKEILGISQNETIKVKELVNMINEEKNKIKSKLSNILRVTKNMIEKRDKYYDYYNNFKIESIPDSITTEFEDFNLKFNLINASETNNLYFYINIEYPDGLKLANNKPDTFKYPVYNSKISNINTINLYFQFTKTTQTIIKKDIVINFNIAPKED